jgi:hypothetical protein
MRRVESNPKLCLRIDLEQSSLDAGDLHLKFEMPEGVRRRFVEGSWDSTTELLAQRAQIDETARRLPYVGGFRA